MEILKYIYKYWFIISGIVSILGCRALGRGHKEYNKQHAFATHT
jgi:hypothetical protein